MRINSSFRHNQINTKQTFFPVILCMITVPILGGWDAPPIPPEATVHFCTYCWKCADVLRSVATFCFLLFLHFHRIMSSSFIPLLISRLLIRLLRLALDRRRAVIPPSSVTGICSPSSSSFFVRRDSLTYFLRRLLPFLCLARCRFSPLGSVTPPARCSSYPSV